MYSKVQLVLHRSEKGSGGFGTSAVIHGCGVDVSDFLVELSLTGSYLADFRQQAGVGGQGADASRERHSDFRRLLIKQNQPLQTEWPLDRWHEVVTQHELNRRRGSSVAVHVLKSDLCDSVVRFTEFRFIS